MTQRKNEQAERNFQLFLFFQRYYSGEALSYGLQDWKEVARVLNSEWLPFKNDNFVKGITILQTIDSDDLESLKYDFSRLFIGPRELLASPYESSYRNVEQLLMQKETLQVRNFYMQAGLAVANYESEPDDHMSIELEFICYLLAKRLEQPAYDQLYVRFLQNHLLKWFEDHCSNIHKYARNKICKAMGLLLLGFLSAEKNRLLTHDPTGGR
ncbi:molecular chaperone TorD family protein [Bacillus sp. DTU_2020_1000418_1_SI_GHA_SEK_038]|uniref:TorD/DmsD family molecular chaperone n=1 Tax=Bacillus sp. DTU_2020_1000418_1_SI_GHA_SEK_038 TaxID=3077585 RepID=UPI0028E86115|nr:molecular chaperone TorD family protein [Bacillus sp. DTU_2020_1000418_1_SI_GHA_SEK_038]WNS74066.1 molecular chaperone TorD family protein [Bacillus sp. DTU_2020_1000418_1_SI_GHA_SEK_038]